MDSIKERGMDVSVKMEGEEEKGRKVNRSCRGSLALLLAGVDAGDGDGRPNGEGAWTIAPIVQAGGRVVGRGRAPGRGRFEESRGGRRSKTSDCGEEVRFRWARPRCRW